MLTYIAIAGKELVRKRVFVAVLVLSLVFLLVYGFGVYELQKFPQNSADSSQNLLQSYMNGVLLLDLGLFFAHFVVAFFVVFSSMGAVSGEIENGMLLAVLARPRTRRAIYLAKWTGHAVWSLLFSAVLFWAIVLTIKIWVRIPLDPAALLRSFALFEWIPLLLLTISLLGSVYLPTLGNGVMCALLFGLGLFGGLFERAVNLGFPHPGIEKMLLVTSLLIPTDSVFRRMTYELIGWDRFPFSDAIADALGPFASSTVPSTAFLVYTVVYAAMLLVWGCRAFRVKDI